MPDMNGFQLYNEIRIKDIESKICFLTASENLSDSTYKFSSMYPIIKKPIENKELIITINDLLNNI
jgi:DNA-binding response OmpR family regulator